MPRLRSGAELLRIFRSFEIKLGTVCEIFIQAARFIPEADLRPHFSTD